MAIVKTLIDRLRRAARELRTANSANVTVTFALATIPIVGFVGAAVDYSHANSVKTSLQAATDATALMLSKKASTMTSAQIQTAATNYLTALFNRPEATGLSVTATYTTSGGTQILVMSSANVKTNFMNLMGFSNMKVAADSKVRWGNNRLRVSLVLDNTGSMSDDGKMTALISATKSLLTQLQSSATTNDDVYVSIVPFVKDVNVGPSNYNANWIDWTDWETAPSGSTPDMSVGPGDNCPYSSWGWGSNGYTCLRQPNGSSTSSIPSSGTYKGYICPSTANGCYNSTQYACTGSSCSCTGHSHCSCSGSGSGKNCSTNSGYYEHAWVPNDHSTWNGCVMDRGDSSAPSSGNYDQNSTAPTTTNTGTLYAAEQYDLCPSAAVKALSYDWSGMTTLVNSMSPNGNTNQAIGLQLGWMSLVGGGPFPTPPAKDPNYQYSTVIILLTDGLNTQDRWYTDQTSIDNRQATLCTNVKAANITLYTIQVNTGGDPTSTLLKNCASDTSKFFLLTSSNQIATVFTQIGTNLSHLRIAQ